jgi:hypothetical protein
MTTSALLSAPTHAVTIFSWIAIAGGLYFFYTGFQLLARKRLLLATPTSRIRSAALGLVEINGVAAGPYTMAAPLSGQPCFLYHTTAWQQRAGKKQHWERIADETLHLPFFVDDSTGQMLIEPLGADLDLHRDFHEEYDSRFFSSSPDIPASVSSFLKRHGITPSGRLRVEERTIKPGESIFVAGTLTENPGVQVRPAEPRSFDSQNLNSPALGQPVAQEVVRLAYGAAASTSEAMSQQGKIAAALTRAGITKPEAWSAAGVPYQAAGGELGLGNLPRPNGTVHQLGTVPFGPSNNTSLDSSDFDLKPPVVLMKGANQTAFVISFRSQKEFISTLAWKSAVMVWGGAGITLLGLYTLSR